MKTYNKTIIIGRLGSDPELKTRNTKGGPIDVASFPICNTAVENGQEVVQWHNIAAFGKQAILCHQHLNKGDLCCIEGKLDAASYTNANGDRVTKQRIVAERITFLSKKRESNNE